MYQTHSVIFLIMGNRFLVIVAVLATAFADPGTDLENFSNVDVL